MLDGAMIGLLAVDALFDSLMAKVE
jgi:hypothetical protein